MSEKRIQEPGSVDEEENIKKPKLDLNVDAEIDDTSDKKIEEEGSKEKSNSGEDLKSKSQDVDGSQIVEKVAPIVLTDSDVPEATSESSEAKDKAEPALLDPLSYTKSEEFTSEIFKIQLHNLPKFGFNDLKKRIKTHLQLNPHKIKSDRRYVTYVCFKNEADRDEALQKINGHVWKGKTLEAKIAAPVSDPYLRKRFQEADQDELAPAAKVAKSDQAPAEEGQRLTPEEAEAKLRANVSPLWDIDYARQLEIKADKIKDVLRRVTRNNFVKHLFDDRSHPNGLACELLPILPSPVTSEYRNKNEFSVGYGLDREVMVGFRYGMYKDGTTSVGDSTNLGIAMPAAIPVVKSFKEFICKSKWLPYRQETGTGHWQTLTVRTFLTGDVMAVVDFVPRKMDQAELDSVKTSLKEFYTAGEGKNVTITSFYFRVKGGKGESAVPSSELLFGESHVYESLLGLKFRISPEAFFQVNTVATEKLYTLIFDLCGASPSSTVLDICCGTGTIGLSLAKNVKDVVGIEMCLQAVEDARVNAGINGRLVPTSEEILALARQMRNLLTADLYESWYVTPAGAGINNATFHCAKVEDVIQKIVSSLPSSADEDWVAVVDPPRPGLHKNVIKTLRKSTSIQRLVYVSCNPDGAMENFVDLIRPETGRHKGAPFKMVKAVPVDLFPGTRHCELVVLFTRADAKPVGGLTQVGDCDRVTKTDNDGENVTKTDNDGENVTKTDNDGENVTKTDNDGENVTTTDNDGENVTKTDNDGENVTKTDNEG